MTKSKCFPHERHSNLFVWYLFPKVQRQVSRGAILNLVTVAIFMSTIFSLPLFDMTLTCLYPSIAYHRPRFPTCGVQGCLERCVH